MADMAAAAADADEAGAADADLKRETGMLTGEIGWLACFVNGGTKSG
jgi:hypothetical protein